MENIELTVEELLEKDGNIVPGENTELLDRLTNSVKDILNKSHPDYLDYENRTFTVESGSTVVMISVRPFTETEVSIECVAQVVSGSDITPELLAFLLRKNAELHFGAFGLLFDNTITFSHSVIGSNMNEIEFLHSLRLVGLVADHYDDKIVAIAGGKRACDSTLSDLS